MNSWRALSHVERLGELLSRGDLNEFYRLLDSEIRRIIGSGGSSEDDFWKLVRLRTLTPILVLHLFKHGSMDLVEARKVALKTSLTSEGMCDLADKLNAGTSETASVFYQNMMGELKRNEKAPEEKFIRISVLEVGAKQRTITRTGGFKEMRGASLLIDSLPRMAADVVRKKLGQEFILTEEAGELVFLSTPDLEKGLTGEIQYVIEKIPFSDTLQMKVNFGRAPLLSVGDLLMKMGMSYVLSLASTRELNVGCEDRLNFQQDLLCQSCRNEISLTESEMIEVLNELFSPPDEMMDLIRRDFPEGRICRKCLSQWIYGHCLVQLLNGKDQGWSQGIKEVVERSNVFKVLRKLKEFAECKGLRPVFVTNLDEYNYEDSNALIAMVAADGDRFGRLKGDSRSIVDFYALSNLFTTIMMKGFIKGAERSLDMELSIQNCLGRGHPVASAKIPITPIFIAGDDMLFIIRAEHLIEFMRGFHERAREIAEGASRLKVLSGTIGVSMGAAVARTKVPGLFLYESSHEIQRGLKRVVRNSKIGGMFATHLHLAYLKSSASRGLVSKVSKLISDGTSGPAVEDEANNLRRWLIWLVDEEGSPVVKAFLKAQRDGSAAGRLRGDDLKEVLEELLSDRVSPELALLRWMSDISRAMDSEDQEKREKAERMREVVRLLFGSGISGVRNAWVPVYLLSSLLDMLEDRVEREARGREEVDHLMSCILGG